MTLTAHAIVGAGIAAAMPAHPALGIALAFASHFAVDAIPHWDYPIRSASIDPQIAAPMRYDRRLLLDAYSIGADFMLGMSFAIVLFPFIPVWLSAAAAFAGMFPDALQFAYMRLKREPLVSLQRFHEWIHARYRFRGHAFLGLVLQAAFLIVCALLVKTFFGHYY